MRGCERTRPPEGFSALCQKPLQPFLQPGLLSLYPEHKMKVLGEGCGLQALEGSAGEVQSLVVLE